MSTQDEVEHAEADGWSKLTWDALADAGFPWVGIAEANGGSGGSLYDLAAIVRAVGAHAAPVPIAETAMLGGWLPGRGGLDVARGAGLGRRRTGTHRRGSAARRRHRRVGPPRRRSSVAVAGGRVVAIPRERLTVTEGANLAGEARDHVVADLALADVESGDRRVGRRGRPWRPVATRCAVARDHGRRGAVDRWRS